MEISEKDFLASYDYTKYDRPSIAADIVIFAVMTNKSDMGKLRDEKNLRKLPPRKLKVLLIKRGEHPYKGKYALPGGFVHKDEDVYDAASRELYEETHVKQSYLKLMDVYSKKGRDPRGWIMSNTFMALINGQACEIKADTDAGEARWFDLTLEEHVIKDDGENDSYKKLTEYRMKLVSEEGQDVLCPNIVMESVFSEFHEKTSVVKYEGDGLAFDHGIIILRTLLELRRLIQIDARIVFDFLPGDFTYAELQDAFELVQGVKLTTPNFRRKIKDYCVETDKYMEGVGHRPAMLIRRNLDMFRK